MFGNKSIGKNILVIDKYFKLFFKKSLKSYDLNTAEGLVLLVLYSNDGKTDAEILNQIHDTMVGKTQDQIIDELHYDKGVMARTMQSLESKGYVTRNDNPNDSRSYLFTLTHSAVDFKPKLIAILNSWNDQLLCDIDSETLFTIKNGLKKMSKNACEAVNRLD